MTAIGVRSFIRDGVLVEELTPVFAILNPDVYKMVAAGGGAIAIRLEKPSIMGEGVTSKQHQIVILKEFMDQLNAEEFEFVLMHELAHIRNGDLDHNTGPRLISNLAYEEAADLPAVEKLGAAVAFSAILKVEKATYAHFTKIKSEWMLSALAWILRTRIGRKRLNGLKAKMK